MGVTLHQRAGTPLIAAVLGLTAGVFVLDLVLPLGIAVAMLYAIPLLVTSKRLPRTFTLGLAACASCLTLLDFLLSAPGPALWPAVANRSLSLVTIWVTAILVIRNKRAILGQQDQEAQRRLLLEQLPALLWVADTNLTITFVQGRILSTLGLTPEGVVGTTAPEYFPLEATSTPFTTHLRALQGDPGSYVAIFKERTLRAYVEPMRNPVGVITGCIGIALDITEQKQLEEQRERLIEELRNALTHIKTLRGLLPICAACKKIRDDHGYWTQIEQYIRAHSEAEFTHGICPECVKKLYPELSSSA